MDKSIEKAKNRKSPNIPHLRHMIRLVVRNSWNKLTAASRLFNRIRVHNAAEVTEKAISHKKHSFPFSTAHGSPYDVKGVMHICYSTCKPSHTHVNE